jgi:hypothetical protein
MDSKFELVEELLLQNRVNCGADSVKGMGRCLEVNFKAACFFAQHKLEGTESHAWYDDDFKNLNWSGNNYHIVGTYKASNGYWVAYDGTADQVGAQPKPVVLVFGDSQEDVLQQLNKQLGGNFNKEKKLRVLPNM